MAPIHQVTIHLVRSWDSGVYIIPTNDQMKGWAILDDRAHGVAAAAQASGVKVWMKYNLYDPNWCGQGLYHGVQLAFDKGVF